jgi:hypothetical protein
LCAVPHATLLAVHVFISFHFLHSHVYSNPFSVVFTLHHTDKLAQFLHKIELVVLGLVSSVYTLPFASPHSSCTFASQLTLAVVPAFLHSHVYLSADCVTLDGAYSDLLHGLSVGSLGYDFGFHAVLAALPHATLFAIHVSVLVHFSHVHINSNPFAVEFTLHHAGKLAQFLHKVELVVLGLVSSVYHSPFAPPHNSSSVLPAVQLTLTLPYSQLHL